MTAFALILVAVGIVALVWRCAVLDADNRDLRNRLRDHEAGLRTTPDRHHA